MSEDVKPCPFCGSGEVTMSYSATMESIAPKARFIECDECGACGPNWDVIDGDACAAADRAQDAWNTRASTQRAERFAEALGFTEDRQTDDASLNLQGALHDLENRFKPNDGGVCARTISRVIAQLDRARAALAAKEPTPTDPDPAAIAEGEAIAACPRCGMRAAGTRPWCSDPFWSCPRAHPHLIKDSSRGRD